MKVIAFVGPSGTGKSYRSLTVGKNNNVDGIIDDGLLISSGKVIAGTSAKTENTRIASVKHALFIPKKYAEEMKGALKKSNIKKLMILGTSEGMVIKIANRLEIGPIEKFIHIEDVATDSEIAMANRMRMQDGKHVIPVPTFEIQKDFSGYFLHPLRLFKKDAPVEEAYEKTIVRPTFSYLGDYTISDNVIVSAVRYEAMKEKSVYRVTDVGIRTSNHGAHLDVTLIMNMCESIPNECIKIQKRIQSGIERNTAINVRRVHIYVKGLYLGKHGIMYKLLNR